MKAKVLMTLLLSVLAAPSVAGDAIESVFIGPAIQVAQLTPDERRMLRERWEMASPEERMAMRRRFQERMQQPSSEPRQRDQWVGRLPTPPGPAEFAGMAGGFGSGFEQRRPDSSGVDDTAPVFDPRFRFNPPAGRGRR